jgi:hypothetical protein
MTFAQFCALSRERSWEEYRSAFLCSAIGKYLSDPKKSREMKIENFLPERFGKKRGKRRQTDEQLQEQIEAVMFSLGGAKK